MKVLEIGLDWFPEHGGGLDRYFHDLIVASGRTRDLDVQGLVVGSPAVNGALGGRMRSVGARQDPLLWRLAGIRSAVSHSIAHFRPDLVAVHFALHALPALDRIKVPLVLHFQGPWASESAMQGFSGLNVMAKRAVERLVFSHVRRFIVLSHAFAEILNETYGVDPARIDVVPGSIDVDRFDMVGQGRDNARRMLGWPCDRRILLSVRRLVRRMGLEQLIEAMARVVAHDPRVLLLIAGRGPEEAALSQRIAASGLEGHIRLLGYLPDDDLPSAYRAADLTLVPTEALEGFGLITAESLAAGTPCMVTPVGGLPEAVAPLSPELVLRGSDTVAIAAGLIAWCEGSLIVPNTDQCRDYARKAFGWDTGLARLSAVYAQALAG